MNFINFAKSESRLKEGAYGQKYYSASQEKSKVVTPNNSAKEFNTNSRTPTKGNASGMRVLRKRKGSSSNVYKKVSDVSGKAYKGMVKRRNELGTKVSKAINKSANLVRSNPLKTGLALAAAGGLGYAGYKAIRKMRSDKGRKRK